MRGAREDGDYVAHVLLVSHVILGEHLDRVDGWMACGVIASVTHVCQSTKDTMSTRASASDVDVGVWRAYNSRH